MYTFDMYGILNKIKENIFLSDKVRYQMRNNIIWKLLSYRFLENYLNE